MLQAQILGKAPITAHGAIYAGIVSTGTPPDVVRFMAHLGYRLARAGYTLRSGATHAYKETFLAGCTRAGGAVEIWLPWAGFAGHQGHAFLPELCHIEIAAQVHSGMLGPSKGAGRLVAMVAGPNLEKHAEFLVCWTPDGCESSKDKTHETGTTFTAIAAAEMFKVPVFNLQQADTVKRLAAFLNTARSARLQSSTS